MRNRMILDQYPLAALFLSAVFCHAHQAIADENSLPFSRKPENAWSFSARGGYAHQFAADLDDGSSFYVDRFFIQGGPTYSPGPQKSVSLAVGYGFNAYAFSGAREHVAAISWGDVNSFRISLPVRWGVDSRWSAMAVPAVRFTGENGVGWNDAVTAGGFAGFSYRFSDRLTIGPGIGIFSQLEDDITLFPILLLSWKITDSISLNTGGGLAATMGPGLTLNWKFTDHWEFYAGGRYDKLRFRLDSEEPSPDGIGENSSFPLFFGATYHFNTEIMMSLIGGLSLAGELRLEDDNGRLLVKDHHDPAGFMGLTFRFRL